MPKVDPKKFFQEQSVQSRVKAEVVFNFVTAWLQIIVSSQSKRGEQHKAAYVDLFSGPGTYEDGNRSTPLMIMERVISNKQHRDALHAYFNDEVEAFTNSLEQEITLISGFEQISVKPVYTSQPASTELFASLQLSEETPLFLFLDQFGYSDVTPSLIRSAFRHRKCDCAFFFRTSRVIGAVTNQKTEESMRVLFGEAILGELRKSFKSRSVDKEGTILRALEAVMRDAGASYFLPFHFRIQEKDTSKHHLIYLGKHDLGFGLMKDIMARASSRHHDGVPLLGYSDVPSQPTLFDSDLILGLQRELLAEFAGQERTVGTIYSSHHPRSNRFILRNYQDALRRLEEEGRVFAVPNADQRPTRNGTVTMGESVQIRFPEPEQ